MYYLYLIKWNNLKIATTFLKNKHFMLKVGILPPL